MGQNFTYTKNPLWGQPGEPEMLAPVSNNTPDPPAKVRQLCWEDFRKLFTDAELEALDSYDLAGCPVSLTDAQKVKLRAFIEKGKSRGAAFSIDVTTNGIATALDYLVARGFIQAGRKAEIIAGDIKS